MPHTAPIPPIMFSDAQPLPHPLLPPCIPSTAPAFPGTGHVLGDQTAVDNAPVSVATAKPADIPPVATPASALPAPLDDRSYTRITIVNGKAKVSCNGPVCRENGKPPVRNAQFCVNQFCQKCCLRFQALGGPQCMGTHDPASAKQSKATSSLLLSQPVSTPMLQVQAASVPTVASVQGLQAPIQPTLASSSQSVSAPVPQVPTLPNAVSNASGVLLLPSQALAPTATLYNAKRPMDDAHYQAREAKHKAWEQRATQLSESRAKSELLKTTIDVVYWTSTTDTPDFLTIPCPSFPTFTLSECSSTMRSMLGIEDDFDKFISMFDPNRARWVNHTAMTLRDISLHRTLLYRAPNVHDGAPDMQTSIDENRDNNQKSRKLTKPFICLWYCSTNLIDSGSFFVIQTDLIDGPVPNGILKTFPESLDERTVDLEDTNEEFMEVDRGHRALRPSTTSKGVAQWPKAMTNVNDNGVVAAIIMRVFLLFKGDVETVGIGTAQYQFPRWLETSCDVASHYDRAADAAASSCGLTLFPSTTILGSEICYKIICLISRVPGNLEGRNM
ncbi:hypothetical protein CPC08DRAFT_756271 [Agrocybe pediades]|nr:hypothetical protein CPC08DRAFT_756271 [Agrocybe pediades]